MQDEIKLQREYYRKTADEYDQMHICLDKPLLSLCLLTGVFDYLQVKSLLDIGSGTGRVIRFIKEKRPDVKILGVEPVAELRNVGFRNGLQEDELIYGDATSLDFDENTFDLVCEFGVLHHIKNPRTVIGEMIRVAQKAILISDSNNFGQGSGFKRWTKQLLNWFGLWRVANYIKTKGKGYEFSKSDGITYSYSVYNDYTYIKKHCQRVYIFDTCGLGTNPYRNADHVTLLGIKQTSD